MGENIAGHHGISEEFMYSFTLWNCLWFLSKSFWTNSSSADYVGDRLEQLVVDRSWDCCHSSAQGEVSMPH